MKMRTFLLLSFLTLFLAVGFAQGQKNTEKNLEDAWAAFESGDIPLAHACAQEGLANKEANNEARHVLFLTAFVSGDYEGSLLHYASIGESYERLGELDEPVLNAYLHLNRFDYAERFARQHGMPEWHVDVLARQARHPLKVDLDKVTVVPFAEHFLVEYFPGFDAEINGTKVTAHIDTGGTFLHMGPKRAKRLGIELLEGGTGHHGSREVSLFHGIAETFRLGEVKLENVPVVVLPSLVGGEDFIIFGTKILQQFLSTLDYPNKRLILSPRQSERDRERHLALLPRRSTRVPFSMWGDHFMFVRGSVGNHTGLNFFVDSGLVDVTPDGKGGMLQSAFTTSQKKFLEWGFTEDQTNRPRFESNQALAIGPLEQTELLFRAGTVGDTSFGGVRIDGLISHAFLKRYSWTIDFDRREYIFASE